MAKLLWHGSHSERGTKVLVEEAGPSVAPESPMRLSMGDTLETMYRGFGEDDYDAMRIRTTALLTAEDSSRRRGGQTRHGPGARERGIQPIVRRGRAARRSEPCAEHGARLESPRWCSKCVGGHVWRRR